MGVSNHGVGGDNNATIPGELEAKPSKVSWQAPVLALDSPSPFDQQ